MMSSRPASPSKGSQLDVQVIQIPLSRGSSIVGKPVKRRGILEKCKPIRVPKALLDSVKSQRIGSRLRVAIFNAVRVPGNIHPAASTCFVALAQTPWFHSKAVQLLLGGSTFSARGCGVPMSRPPVLVEMLRADDIRAGRLDNGFDVIVIPGGSAMTDSRLLGEVGREAIRRFVFNGGGYCGICAGAFLALKGWPSSGKVSLKLVNASVRRRESDQEDRDAEDDDSADSDTNVHETVSSVRDPSDQCQRSASLYGGAPVQGPRMVHSGRDAKIVRIQFSKIGRRLLWAEGRTSKFEDEESKKGVVQIRYHNGPLMIPTSDSTALVLGNMHVAASAEADPEVGVGAFLMEDVGAGRAMLISPHPESTQEFGFGPDPGKPRLRRILQRAVLLAAAGSEDLRWIEEMCNLPA